MSGIEWTGPRRWNPVRGCTRISPGCENCYAELLAARMPWGKGFAEMTKAGPRWTGRVELLPERLAIPLRWRKPQLVFMDSTFDLFHEALPFEAIAAVFGVMAACPQHTFQVLTKRARRMREWAEWVSWASRPQDRLADCAHAIMGGRAPGWRRIVDDAAWPLANVWLGVSAEDQQRANERIPELLATPAAVRFLSCEPLLGPLDLRPYLFRNPDPRHRCCPRCLYATNRAESVCPADLTPLGPDIAINWVIVGGESGRRARPCDVAWIRSIRDQCRDAGTAFFCKQLGAVPVASCSEWDEPCEGDRPCHGPFHLRDRKGGDMLEWPADLRVREFPA